MLDRALNTEAPASFDRAMFRRTDETPAEWAVSRGLVAYPDAVAAMEARAAALAEIRDGRVGVWVERRTPGLAPREDKIAAIGVKLRRWVSFHGISLNVEPDLGHFAGIVPCGVTDHGVTSLVDLGLPVTMDEADAALKAAFSRVFGPTSDARVPFGG